MALTGGNLLLNADGGPGGAGSTLSIPPAALGADGVLDPGESFSVDFRIGLARLRPFDFFVDAYGVPSGGTTSAPQTLGHQDEGFRFEVTEKILWDAFPYHIYLPRLGC